MKVAGPSAPVWWSKSLLKHLRGRQIVHSNVKGNDAYNDEVGKVGIGCIKEIFAG